MPAYELDPSSPTTSSASIQFSSGCPYQCEFCDIPALYGRNPRLKTAAQVLAELDQLRSAGGPVAVYFVDDNFIAQPEGGARPPPAPRGVAEAQPATRSASPARPR